LGGRGLCAANRSRDLSHNLSQVEKEAVPAGLKRSRLRRESRRAAASESERSTALERAEFTSVKNFVNPSLAHSAGVHETSGDWGPSELQRKIQQLLWLLLYHTSLHEASSRKSRAGSSWAAGVAARRDSLTPWEQDCYVWTSLGNQRSSGRCSRNRVAAQRFKPCSVGKSTGNRLCGDISRQPQG